MSRRLYKINELLSQELAKLVQEEFAEKYGIITINLLDTSHNLDKARAYISILDTKSKNKDKILGILNNHSSSFQKYLVKKLHLKKFLNLNLF